MPTYFGNKRITKIFFGKKRITKVFYGKKLVFSDSGTVVQPNWTASTFEISPGGSTGNVYLIPVTITSDTVITSISMYINVDTTTYFGNANWSLCTPSNNYANATKYVVAPNGGSLTIDTSTYKTYSGNKYYKATFTIDSISVTAGKYYLYFDTNGYGQIEFSAYSETDTNNVYSNFAYFYKYYWWDIINTDGLCTNKGGPVSGPWPWVEINGNKLESWK